MRGFAADRCIPIRADGTRQMVRWQSSSDLSRLIGKPVRIRFYLVRAQLYSFWSAQAFPARVSAALPREARALMGRKTALPMPVPLRANRHTQDNFILGCCADDCGLGGAEED